MRLYRACCALLLFFILLCFSLLTPTAWADGYPIIGALHAGSNPEALAIDTQTHLLYMAFESPGVIAAFDAVHSQVKWRTTLGEVATDVQVDSTRHLVYAASTSYSTRQSTLSLLDGATGHILSSIRIGNGDDAIALDSTRQLAYVADGDDVSVMATTGNILRRKTQLRVQQHPSALGVNSRTGRLYVADAVKHLVTVIDEDTRHTLTTIAVGEVPLHPIRVDEQANRVYVLCSTSQELDVIDGATNRVIAHPPVRPYPEGIDFSTTSGRIYVANEGTKENGPGAYDIGTTLTVIDTHTFVPLGTLTIGKAPDGVAVDADLHRVYVAVENSNAVVEVVDAATIPLQDSGINQAIAAEQTVHLLQQATIVTLVVMLATVVLATLFALSRRWRVRESPQSPPGASLSRSEKHSLPL